MAAVKDYYKTLGIEKGVKADEIKKSYRKLARKYHPDLNPGDKAAEQKFKDLSEAYAVLSDAEKRKEYDNFGRSPFDGGGSGGFGGMGGPGGFGGMGARQSYSNFDFDFGDIFGDILGSGGGARTAQSSFRKGADIATAVKVSLKEAFTGTTKRMTYKREVPCNQCQATGVEASEFCPTCHGTGKTQTTKGFFKVADRCSSCGGTGRRTTKTCTDCAGVGKTVSNDTVTVRIPAGVDNGSSVKLRGKGNGGFGGGPAGDLRLKISVSTHSLFERTGDNIELRLPITFPEAAMGAKIEVPTIDGSTMMTIPAGTQGGQRFKLSGKGFARPGAGARGDMYITTVVTVPKKMDKAAIEAAKTLESSYEEDPREGMGPS